MIVSAKYETAAWCKKQLKFQTCTPSLLMEPHCQLENRGHMHERLYGRCTACNGTNFGTWLRYIAQWSRCKTTTKSVLHIKKKKKKREGTWGHLTWSLVSSMAEGKEGMSLCWQWSFPPVSMVVQHLKFLQCPPIIGQFAKFLWWNTTQTTLYEFLRITKIKNLILRFYEPKPQHDHNRINIDLLGFFNVHLMHGIWPFLPIALHRNVATVARICSRFFELSTTTTKPLCHHGGYNQNFWW